MINKETEEALKSFKSEYESCNHNSSDLIIELETAELILQYIEQLENKVKELGKGQHTLMQSRRKWKNRYYKEKRKNVE